MISFIEKWKKEKAKKELKQLRENHKLNYSYRAMKKEKELLRKLAGQ